jgi:hypothetical protein
MTFFQEDITRGVCEICGCAPIAHSHGDVWVLEKGVTYFKAHGVCIRRRMEQLEQLEAERARVDPYIIHAADF